MRNSAKKMRHAHDDQHERHEGIELAEQDQYSPTNVNAGCRRSLVQQF